MAPRLGTKGGGVRVCVEDMCVCVRRVEEERGREGEREIKEEDNNEGDRERETLRSGDNEF